MMFGKAEQRRATEAEAVSNASPSSSPCAHCTFLLLPSMLVCPLPLIACLSLACSSARTVVPHLKHCTISVAITMHRAIKKDRHLHRRQRRRIHNRSNCDPVPSSTGTAPKGPACAHPSPARLQHRGDHRTHPSFPFHIWAAQYDPWDCALYPAPVPQGNKVLKVLRM